MSVALSQVFGAGWQIFNDDGIPLSGGLIYTYQAGTNTPQSTYTDYTGNVANSNPIQLDASGRFANQVWVDIAFNYKFVLKTSAGVTIGTYDNITSPTSLIDAFAAKLANTSNVAEGDALVGFKQANASGLLAGAVGRTVHSKLTEFVNIQDFGAVMNDSSSGTRTANRAAYLAAVAAGVKSLYIPQGTLWIDGDIEYGDILVKGAGKWHTTIKGNGDLFKQSQGGGTGGFYDLQLQNDTVRGKLFKYAGVVDTGFPEFSRVYFNTAEYHIYAPGPAIVGFKLNDCHFLDSSNYSRYFESLWVHEEVNCYTWYCEGGLWVNGTLSTCSIRGSVYEQINKEAIKATNTGSSEISPFDLIGIHFEFNGKSGYPDIYLATTGPGRIRAVNVIGCGFFSPDVAQTPAHIQIVAGGGGNIDAINLKGSSFYGNLLAVSPDNQAFIFDGNYFQGAPNSANLSASRTNVQVPFNFNNYLGATTTGGPLAGNNASQASITPPSGTKFAKVFVYGNTYNGTTPGTNNCYLEGVVLIAPGTVYVTEDNDSTLGGAGQGAVLTYSGGAINVNNKSGMSANQSVWTTVVFYS